MSSSVTENHQRSSTSTVDIKYQYYRLINHEFRSLQLDPELRNKSLFDLIDYCELLYEKSVNTQGEAGVKTYVRGYLIFNYFINSFIMMHFRGFDAFLESNEQDFIIYLNIFAFYTSNDLIKEKTYEVSLKSIRKWVIQYLDSKDLIKFDYDSLYKWLNEYISYLKHKREQELGEEHRKSAMDPLDNRHNMASERILEQANGKYPREEDFGEDVSIEGFVSKFPSLRTSVDNSKENAFESHESSQSHRTTPYPRDLIIPSLEDNVVPYPLVDPTEEKHFDSDRAHDSYRQPISDVSIGLNRRLPPSKKDAIRPVTVSSVNDLKNMQHRSTRPMPNGGDRRSTMSEQQIYTRPQPQVPRHQKSYTPQGSHAPQSSSNHISQSNDLNGGHNSHSYSVPEFVPIPRPNVVDKNNRMQCMQQYAICGLKNFGSSCYINSTIQLLFGIDLLKSLIENQGYKNYVRDARFLRYLNVSNISRDSLLLSEALSGLLKVFGSHGSASIAPTRFLRIISLLKPDFHVPHQQQDAQEFLLFVLDRLHEEMSERIFNGNELSISYFEEYISRWNVHIKPKDKDNYIKWYKFVLETEGSSPVHDLFQGHLQNKLLCYKCGHESVSYSPFTILSLPIPPNNNGIVNVSDCLSYYTQDEILSGENSWNCPKCSKEAPSGAKVSLDDHPVFSAKKSGPFRFARRNKSPSKDKSKKNDNSTNKQDSVSIKSLNFIKLPRILLVHLSRFSKFNMTDKLNTNIQYPLQLKFNNEEHYVTYKLSGIINHYGNLSSGHYTALINKSLCTDKVNSLENLYDPYWCLFDDENVRVNLPHGSATPSANQNINSRDVYVLCYEIVL